MEANLVGCRCTCKREHHRQHAADSAPSSPEYSANANNNAGKQQAQSRHNSTVQQTLCTVTAESTQCSVH